MSSQPPTLRGYVSNTDPAQQAAEAALAQANKELAWELSKAAVDVAGIADPTPISDAVGAAMSLSDGDYVGAGLSLLSIIPYAGDALGKTAKGARAAKKINDLRKKVAGLSAKVEALKNIARRAPDPQDALKKSKRAPDKPVKAEEICPPTGVSKQLYDRLRANTPSPAIRKMVNKGQKPPYPDPVLPGAMVKGPLNADHIVPMKKITEMPGFNKLSYDDQLKVLNNKQNFIGLSESANKSKGAKSFSEWTEHKSKGIKVNEAFRQEMIKKEKQLQGELQQQINGLLKQKK